MDRLETVVVIAILLLVGTLFGFLIVSASISSACLAAGYPKATMDWKFTAYCIKRVDQTDVVIPLKAVK